MNTEKLRGMSLKQQVRMFGDKFRAWAKKQHPRPTRMLTLEKWLHKYLPGIDRMFDRKFIERVWDYYQMPLPEDQDVDIVDALLILNEDDDE